MKQCQKEQAFRLCRSACLTSVSGFAGRIDDDYRLDVLRAKDIGKSRLLNAYFMGAYFIALNRGTECPAEENYQFFQTGLYRSRLFRMAIGNAEAYLDRKKLPGRILWAKQSQKRCYENDWVVDILDKTADFELGYDYHTCGVCRLCQDEGCPELAKYLCRLDFVMADLMGMKLVRTQTIAEGAAYCDFRYSRKQKEDAVE